MEKQNNIILAPSSSQVTELYKLWRENHAGRLSDFYKFLTSPTDQRDQHIQETQKEGWELKKAIDWSVYTLE